MEKENMKKTSADKERRKKLTNAILMAFVCILMMSGATYAWFTMSNNAKVTSLKLNVASEGNLYIGRSATEVTKKKSEVTWFGTADATDGREIDTTTIETLYPCTTSNGRDMYKPVYSKDDVVSSVEPILENDSDKESYYLQRSFWLLLDDGLTGDDAVHSDYTVHLATGTGLGTSDTTDDDGTYFICTETETPTYLPQYCVRVSFTVGSGNTAKTYVYEPNCEVHNGSAMKKATNSLDSNTYPVASGYKQNSNGTWDGLDTTAKESKEMFTIEGGTATEVVVRVWFEGTDDDCGNEIEMNDIMGQLKFVANKTTTTSGGTTGDESGN